MTQPSKKLAFSTPRSFYIGIVAAVLVTLAIGAALYFLITRTNADASARLLRETAASNAGTIEAWMSRQSDLLQKTAARPDVIRALSGITDNDSSLDLLGQKIREENEGFEQVNLIPWGKSENFPLSFAQLDQVKRTEKGETTSPEAITVNGNWIFYISTPVWNASREQIVGTLFVIENIDRIKAPFGELENTYGSNSLVQTFYNTQPRIIFTTGDVAPQLLPENLAQIGKSHWSVLFTPSPEFYKEHGVSPTILLGILIALGVILAVVVIVLLRAARNANLKLYKTIDGPAAARKLSRGGKVDASRVAALVAEESDDTDESSEDSHEDFNSIADPLFQHNDILDISDVEIGDDSLALSLDAEPVAAAEPPKPAATPTQPAAPAAVATPAKSTLNPAIFRDYDIRGDAALHLPDDIVYAIGQSIGSEALARNQIRLAVAADGRLSSPRIKEALIRGILATGANVVDIGNVPSPVLYFACATTDIQSGVIVTASHNRASDNGFKIVLKGKTLAADGITALRDRITAGNFARGSGTLSKASHTEDYLDKITADIALSDSLKVVVDCGNGIAGEIAPTLLERLTCDVVPLFCEVDGAFPNHEPDPSVDSNLKALVQKVQEEKADLGIALDGDGDRLVAVSSSGKIVAPDRLLMIFAKDVVSRHPGCDVIFDVKCTRRLNSLISGYGGRPLMWKSGHAHIKSKMQETGAMLAGELSGHIFFKDRWLGFDDGLYATARLLEILTTRSQSLDAVLATLPVSAITPEIRINVEDEKKFEYVQRLIERGNFSGGKLTTFDGLRVDFAKGWGLIRASNTSPCLTLRFEADNDEMLTKIRDLFRQQMKAIVPEVHTTF